MIITLGAFAMKVRRRAARWASRVRPPAATPAPNLIWSPAARATFLQHIDAAIVGCQPESYSVFLAMNPTRIRDSSTG
jgi:hypothetical protein